MKRSFLVSLAILLATSAALPGCVWWVGDEGHRHGEFHERDHGDRHGDHHDHHDDRDDHHYGY